MTKKEFPREYRVKGVPLTVQAHMGVLWDVAYEQGLRDGRDKGIREMIAKEEDNLHKVYEAGIYDANVRASASFRAAVCKVLHKMHGFGAMRCNRVVAAVSEELVGMGTQGLQGLCEEVGVMIQKHSLTDLCRKVVFRGMAHGGEWVYGSLIQVGACCLIWGDGAQEGVEVYPGSVGQDTMMRDTHGKAIFEGDIISVRLPWTRVSLPMDMGLFRVEYHSGAFVAVSPSEAMVLCDLPKHVVIEVQRATFEGDEADEDA